MHCCGYCLRHNNIYRKSIDKWKSETVFVSFAQAMRGCLGNHIKKKENVSYAIAS